jgi:proteasome lid subunit RPN8/RPN11
MVYVRVDALRTMADVAREYGCRDTPVEVAFLCLGRRAEDIRGPYTIIEALPFVAEGNATFVRLTLDAKARARREHLALDVVGWAHTHPGYGIFFSGTDVESCADYGPDGVNLVYDPQARRLGVALGDQIVLVDSLAPGAAPAHPRLSLPPHSPQCTIDACPIAQQAWQLLFSIEATLTTPVALVNAPDGSSGKTTPRNGGSRGGEAPPSS